MEVRRAQFCMLVSISIPAPQSKLFMHVFLGLQGAFGVQMLALISATQHHFSNMNLPNDQTPD